MLIDSHCHLTKRFLDDPTQTIHKAKDNGVEKMICVGTTLEDSKEAIEIAQKFENVFAAVGIHPEENFTGDWVEFEKLIDQPKVVAIGETGLDHKVGLSGQKVLFEKQILLSKKHNKPLILHVRNAQENLMKMDLKNCRGVFHCFSGDTKYLDYILNSLPDFFISFAGNVTFKNAVPLQELAKLVPMGKLLVETDSPLLAPHPLRGSQNEPANVKIVAQFLANLKGVSFEELEKTTSSNATKLFNL